MKEGTEDAEARSWLSLARYALGRAKDKSLGEPPKGDNAALTQAHADVDAAVAKLMAELHIAANDSPHRNWSVSWLVRATNDDGTKTGS